MKFFLSVIFLFLLNCSFDNKTGIWKDANQELKKSIDNSKKKKISLVFKESEVFNNEKDGYSIIRNTYLPYRNKNWSTDPCQLPLTFITRFLPVAALATLKALMFASAPVLQRINL